MQAHRKQDIEDLQGAKPFVRSILAFLLSLRYQHLAEDVDTAYKNADVFIARLESDLQK